MRAFLVSVDYTDLLALTLPCNRHHFTEVFVVTSTADAPSVRPVADACRAEVLATDLFYASGADFNKWLALEWALDHVGRKGWICLMDADVVWPKGAKVSDYKYAQCSVRDPRWHLVSTAKVGVKQWQFSPFC